LQQDKKKTYLELRSLSNEIRHDSLKIFKKNAKIEKPGNKPLPCSNVEAIKRLNNQTTQHLKMNILILSRGPELYSTRSLFFAAQKRGHYVRILDYTECSISIEAGQPMVWFRDQALVNIDAIIPRIGSSATFFGTVIIRQFEEMGVFSLTPSVALTQSRDKLQSLQLLAMAGVDFPKTVFSNLTYDAADIIRQIGGPPLVIKLLSGTHGMGVILAKDQNTAEAVIESFYKTKQRVVLQEFIEEARGEDLRAFVVNGKIIACMKRRAKPGEFRSNLHRGGSSLIVKPDEKEIAAVLKAAKVMGLHVSGVDMLQSKRGPLILEVNASPGLEGIETTTGVDIASQIIEFIETEVAAKK